MYDLPMAQDIKGWLLLMASLFLLLLICGLATVGLLTRPARWSER